MANSQRNSGVWDEQSLGERVLGWALAQPRIPMSEARARRVGKGTAGCYAIFMAGGGRESDDDEQRLVLYGNISTGVVPAYVGASADLNSRLARHHLSLSYAAGIEVEDVWCLTLPTPSIGAALHTEDLLRVALRPVWCDAVTGLGGMRHGSGRGAQKVSLWDALHPGRPWVAAPTELQRAHAAAVLMRHLAPGIDPIWPPLRP